MIQLGVVEIRAATETILKHLEEVKTRVAMSRSICSRPTLDPEAIQDAEEKSTRTIHMHTTELYNMPSIIKYGLRSMESDPTFSPQTNPPVRLTPPVAKRNVEMSPTATGSDSLTVERQTYEWKDAK